MRERPCWTSLTSMTVFPQPTLLTEMVRVMWIQLKWVDTKKVRLVRATLRLRPFHSIFMFNQTFQISILWHPTIPIDHMTDIVAAAPALQIDDLNPQTTPDIHLHKSAMAGKEHQPGFQEMNKIVGYNCKKHCYFCMYIFWFSSLHNFLCLMEWSLEQYQFKLEQHHWSPKCGWSTKPLWYWVVLSIISLLVFRLLLIN